MPKPVKVLFGSRGTDPETAWCVPLPTKNQYRLNNILFLHQTPALGDVIEAREGKQGLVFKRIVKPGGRFTMIVDYPREADFKVLVRHLRAHGVESEGLSKGRLYLAAPKTLAAKQVFELGRTKVNGLVGVHPPFGTPLPQVAPAPKPATIFDAVARNDLAAIKRTTPAELKAVNENGHSLLYLATREGRTQMVKTLLARGADPNPRGKKERPPLFGAVMRNRAKEAKLLLAAGAKPELAKDRDGDVALVVAAFREELAVLRVLLTTKPSVAHLSHAMLEAAGVGNVEIVKLLLKHGADPDRKTRRGNSARSVAQRKKQRAVLALFSKN